jgi:selenocysteine-specific translation elongation factor
MKKIRNIAARAERIKKLESELKEVRKEAFENMGALIFNSYKNNFTDIEEVKNKIAETAEKYGLSSLEKSK